MQPAGGGPDGKICLVGVLPQAVAPGETIDLEMLGFAGGPVGAGRVKLDLLLGERWWFEELGSEPLVRDLEIGDAAGRPPLLELVSSPSIVSASDGFEIAVRVRGRVNGPIDGSPAVIHRGGVGIRWVSGEADANPAEGPRCYFEPPLSPGEVRELRLAVPAGSLTPGRWTAKLDLLQEGLTWFETLGFEPLHLDLTVTRALH